MMESELDFLRRIKQELNVKIIEALKKEDIFDRVSLSLDAHQEFYTEIGERMKLLTDEEEG